MSLIKEDLLAIQAMMREELGPIQSDIADIKQEQTAMKTDIADLKQNQAAIKTDVKDIRKKCEIYSGGS